MGSAEVTLSYPEARLGEEESARQRLIIVCGRGFASGGVVDLSVGLG